MGKSTVENSAVVTSCSEKDDMRELWIRYKKYRDLKSRNILIEKHLALVKKTAERMRMKLPSHLDPNDLISAGVMGLIDAVDRFDITRGIHFTTYCIQRIQGAILDDLRLWDWVPRMVRNRANKLEQCYAKLYNNLERRPTGREVAETMGVSMQEYNKILVDSQSISLVSLDANVNAGAAKDATRMEILENKKCVDPVKRLEVGEIKEVVTRGLNEREKLIIIMYYFDELTMREISSILEMSESRVCQMHADILGRLRSALASRKDELMLE